LKLYKDEQFLMEIGCCRRAVAERTPTKIRHIWYMEEGREGAIYSTVANQIVTRLYMRTR